MAEAEPTATAKANAKTMTTLGIIMGASQMLAGATGDRSNRWASIGSGAGMIAGSLIPIPGVGPILGGMIGGALGGILGGLFDKSEQPKKDLSEIAANTGEMAKQLEVVNRNLIGLKQSFDPYPMQRSYYFKERSTNEELSLERAMVARAF